MTQESVHARRPVANDERDDWLSLAARTAHVAVGISRLSDGAFVEVNDAFCRLFRYARDDVIGHSSAELGLWPDAAQRERMLALLRREGAVRRFEARYRNRLGEEGDLEISSSIVERDGQPHLVGFLTDVSDRRELLDGLRTAHARLDVLLRASGMLAFRQDRELRYTWVANPALGVSESEVLGRSDDELLGRVAAAPLVAVKRRVLASGRAERRDVWVAHNGQLRCFDLIVEPERDATDRVVAVLCAATDITDRVTALRERPGHAERLHSPLHAIEGMTSLMGREGLSARQRQRLQRIELEARRLAESAPSDGELVFERLARRHGGKRVLVAEQNAVLRELVAALLEDAGLQVVQAANGVEAFAFAVQRPPDLLLLDMELPQRGGVAAARALRTVLRRPLPIIAMVSAAPLADAARALDADLDDLIDKPVSAETLYRKALSWLEFR